MDLLREMAPEFKSHSNCKTDEAKAKSIAEKTADFYDDAALSPLYGCILVIGLMDEQGNYTTLEGDEKDVLEMFWSTYEKTPDKWCFWSGSGNSQAFDIDFILTRSRILGVKYPYTIRNGRHYSSRIMDLAAEFLLHNSQSYLSLSNAAAVMGLYRQDASLVRKSATEEVTGKDFARFYRGTPEEKAKAMLYLERDLILTQRLAKRIL